MRTGGNSPDNRTLGAEEHPSVCYHRTPAGERLARSRWGYVQTHHQGPDLLPLIGNPLPRNSLFYDTAIVSIMPVSRASWGPDLTSVRLSTRHMKGSAPKGPMRVQARHHRTRQRNSGTGNRARPLEVIHLLTRCAAIATDALATTAGFRATSVPRSSPKETPVQELVALADSLAEKYANQALVDAKTIQNPLLEMWGVAAEIDAALLVPIQDMLTATSQRSQIAAGDLASLAANLRQPACAPV